MREIKRRIIEILDQQEQKGIETYGHGLEEADPEGWDWDKETIAELVDAIQYQVKESMLLEDELRKAYQDIDELNQEIDDLWVKIEELENNQD